MPWLVKEMISFFKKPAAKPAFGGHLAGQGTTSPGLRSGFQNKNLNFLILIKKILQFGTERFYKKLSDNNYVYIVIRGFCPLGIEPKR